MSILVVLLLIHWACGDPCGLAPVGNCLQGCFAECKTKFADMRDQGVNDTQFEESVAAEAFICFAKCRGNVTIPKKHQKSAHGKDSRHLELDLKECVEPCGDPVDEVCLKGYLTKFFYCDCYKCCETKDKKKDSPCAAACFDRFQKPDAPPGLEVCRFKKEYKHTPYSWCLAYCTWKILKLTNLQISDIPLIANTTALLCSKRCASSIRDGEHWDYETKLSAENCIIEPERCISLIRITKLSVTNGITDAQVQDAPKEYVKNNRYYQQRNLYNGPNSIPDKFMEVKVDHNFTFFRGLSVNWPVAFNDMLESDFVLTCEPIVEKHIQYPNPAQKIDWPVVSRLLVSAFNADKSNAGSPRNVSIEYDIRVTQEVKLHTCETYQYHGVATKPKGLSITLEVHAEVSELQGMTPTLANELKNNLLTKWNSLEYVNDVNENTIAVKGVATVEINFEIDVKIGGSCIEHHATYNGKPICQDPAHDYSAGCVCIKNC